MIEWKISSIDPKLRGVGEGLRRNGRIRKNVLMLISVVLLCLFVFLAGGNLLAAAPKVYVIPIEDTIDPGLAKFVERSYQEAAQARARMVILEIDTPGGRIDSALSIKDTISKSSLPTTALVKGGAISAGAFIALACQKIAMVPGSTIGDIEPRIGNERADEKFLSAWTQEVAATAEKNGRNPDIARAMVDRDIEIPGVKEKGKLLTLTYSQAQEHGYTDYIVSDRADLLNQLGLADADVVETTLSAAEKLTRIVTNPYVAPFLLTIGLAGIVIEFFTIGWGIAGTLGILSLILYFGGHLMAGFTGWEVLLLFLVGIILLVVEAFVPGFGIPGIGGILSIFASIVLAAPSWEEGMISLVLALIGTIVLVMLSLKLLTRRQFWSRLTLGTRYNKEEGYIPQSQDLSKYIGQKGRAYTILRPAGSVILDDGTKLDVVTQGDFIQRGERIEVVDVEGIRVVVKAIPAE